MRLGRQRRTVRQCQPALREGVERRAGATEHALGSEVGEGALGAPDRAVDDAIGGVLDQGLEQASLPLVCLPRKLDGQGRLGAEPFESVLVLFAELGSGALVRQVEVAEHFLSYAQRCAQKRSDGGMAGGHALGPGVIGGRTQPNGLPLADQGPQEPLAGRQAADARGLFVRESHLDEVPQRPPISAEHAERAVLSVGELAGKLHDELERTAQTLVAVRSQRQIQHREKRVDACCRISLGLRRLCLELQEQRIPDGQRAHQKVRGSAGHAVVPTLRFEQARFELPPRHFVWQECRTDRPGDGEPTIQVVPLSERQSEQRLGYRRRAHRSIGRDDEHGPSEFRFAEDRRHIPRAWNFMRIAYANWVREPDQEVGIEKVANHFDQPVMFARSLLFPRVRLAPQDGEGAVDLLVEQNPREPVRQRQARQAEPMLGLAQHGPRQSIRSAEQKGDVALANR